MKLNFASKKIIVFDSLSVLPLTQSTVIKTNKNNNIVTIIGHEDFATLKEKICLPIARTILINFTVDVNGIYYITFDLLQSNERIQEKESLEFTHNTIHYFSKQIPSVVLFHNLLQSKNIVGIDFGNSRCCAAVAKRSGIETIPLDDRGERQLPSYVSYDEQNAKCGQVVINRLRDYATSSIFDFKRIMGQPYENVVANKFWPFRLVNKCENKIKMARHKNIQFNILEKHNAILQLQGYNGIVHKYPEEVSAVLLKHIKNKVEDLQDALVNECVITVPAVFTNKQKESIVLSALMAGWNNVHLLSEPLAAVYSYYIKNEFYNNSTILLFDLGGGTLDISIFKIQDKKMKVIKTGGDFELGGRDFDIILCDYFQHKLQMLYNIKLDGKKRFKLMLQCQNIKENLSINEDEALDVEEIDPSHETFIPIKREEFECLVVELLDRIHICIINSLVETGLTFNQINKVLLVGGGCRMPMIQKLLKSIFSNAEHCCDQHPDEVVALGAAYYSCYLKFSSEAEYELIRDLNIPYKVFRRRHSI